MDDLKVKGRIAEILEGGKVLRQDILRELRSIPEFWKISSEDFDAALNSMLLDETVRKILVENRRKGRIEEYWELNE